MEINNASDNSVVGESAGQLPTDGTGILSHKAQFHCSVV